MQQNTQAHVLQPIHKKSVEVGTFNEILTCALHEKILRRKKTKSQQVLKAIYTKIVIISK